MITREIFEKENRVKVTPNRQPKIDIGPLRKAFQKILGLSVLGLSLLPASKVQAENSSTAEGENSFGIEAFLSPLENFEVGGIALVFGHEFTKNSTFHFGIEIGGHFEIGRYSIDRATFQQTQPVIAGGFIGTTGLALGFDLSQTWTIELVPHGGFGFSWVFPGKVGADFYQNGAVKGSFVVIGGEILLKKEIGSGWSYYLGGAYDGLLEAEEPSAPRGTPPKNLSNDLHIIPIGLEKEW